jgi:hypothetical protein
MDPLDRLLQEDLNHLLDRVAASIPKGMAGAADGRPALRWRLDEAEARLSAMRSVLRHEYEAWRRAIEDYETLWALAGDAEEEEPHVAGTLRAA